MTHLKKLYIEPTSKCNFNCSMCFRNTWFDETQGNLDFADFKKLITTLPDSVETIFFGGMGEPFYHPRILEMLKLSKSLGFHVEILTNGSLLTEDVIKELFTMRLNKLWISIDTLQETTSSNEVPNEMGHPSSFFRQYSSYLRSLSVVRRNIKLSLIFYDFFATSNTQYT